MIQLALVPPAVLLSCNSVQSRLCAYCLCGTVSDDLESIYASDDLSQGLQGRARTE